MARTRIADQASSSAFWLFLSLLPLAAVAGMVVAKIGVADMSVFETVLSAVPPSSRALVREELGKVAAWNGGAVAPLSALTFFWLASSGVHAILDAFDATTESKRAWWQKRAIAIAMCVAFSLGVGALGALVGVAEREAVAKVAFTVATRSFLSYGVGFLIETGLIVALFAAGVARKAERRMHSLWPGAALSAGMHTAVGAGYAEYIGHMGDGGAYRAGLATIGITMSVVYFFTLSLLVGLSLNAAIGEARQSARP